ncbi:MAG: hypothetical protein EAZ27_00090 [Cytophagales bacterium]|nr:MAG: hypothetical protein EAZ27_00090 [Cytophagales bacterium]
MQILSFLIHPSIRNPVHKDFKKAQISSVSLFVIAVALVFYCLYFYIYKPHDIVKNITNLTGLVCLIFTMIALRFSKSILFPLTLLVLISLIVTSVSIFHTGGIYSVDISWLLMIVVTSCFFVNLTIGVIYTFLASFYIIFLYYIENNNLMPMGYFSDYSNQLNATHFIFTWIFVMFFLLALTISFLKTFQNANQKIEELQKKELEDLTKIVDAQNIEINLLREKLASDFHDEVGNKLAGIRILAETVIYKSKHETLDKNDMISILTIIESRARELYDSTRDFVWSVSSNSNIIEDLFNHIKEQILNIFYLKKIRLDSQFKTNSERIDKIQPSISRQIIMIVKEISSVLNDNNLSENMNLIFEVESKFLYISISHSISTTNPPVFKFNTSDNRLQKIKAIYEYKISKNIITYKISIPLNK